MDTPQAICMVRDAEGIRPLMPDERGRVAGFFLFGEGFGDMICLLPTVQKTAQQLAKRLDVWTRRPTRAALLPPSTPLPLPRTALVRPPTLF